MPEHRLPARGIIDLIGLQVPVPQPVIGTPSGQGIPRLTGAQRVLRALVGHLAGDPGQDHREIDRLGDVVIGAQLEGFDDVLALVPRGHHDDRQRGGFGVPAKDAEDVQAAPFRHHDVQEDHVEGMRLDQGHRCRPFSAVMTA